MCRFGALNEESTFSVANAVPLRFYPLYCKLIRIRVKPRIPIFATVQFFAKSETESNFLPETHYTNIKAKAQMADKHPVVVS
jgi:hypothetical protein